MVGVNAHTESNPDFALVGGQRHGRAERFQRVDPKLEARQARALARFRAGRDARKARDATEALAHGTRTGENVMPLVLAAVRAHVTLGEIADVWRREFGEHRPSRAF